MTRYQFKFLMLQNSFKFHNIQEHFTSQLQNRMSHSSELTKQVVENSEIKTLGCLDLKVYQNYLRL